ncbi:hypothetical protein PUN28_017698 [Cardiocondyla obscurior]|uniref:Uncharacterized protein n=1 Tax=Cardiocondyla obscurior TaxID=286306 RepID=A0AAW2EMI2_9HYME
MRHCVVRVASLSDRPIADARLGDKSGTPWPFVITPVTSLTLRRRRRREKDSRKERYLWIKLKRPHNSKKERERERVRAVKGEKKNKKKRRRRAQVSQAVITDIGSAIVGATKAHWSRSELG